MKDVLDSPIKSLEEIVIERTSTHIERGIDGISRQVTRTFKHKLTVKTIGSGLRFVHLIVDQFLIMGSIQLVGIIPFDNPAINGILGLVLLFSYPLFYTIMEYKFQQTPGKMVTGTVVIDNYAKAPGFSVCLLRTLIRFVPFEAFSCMDTPSRGWHDKWTKTYVVAKSEVPKLKALLEKENAAS